VYYFTYFVHVFLSCFLNCTMCTIDIINKYGSSNSEARDLLNLLSDVTSMQLWSEFHFLYDSLDFNRNYEIEIGLLSAEL